MATPRKSKEQRHAEAQEEAAWCLSLLNALKPHIEEIFPSLERVLHQAADAADLRGLRMVSRDLVGMCRDFPSSELDELNAALLARFGRDLRTVDQKDRRTVNHILKRGALRSDEEFRFLREQLDDQDKAEKLTQSEIERIDRILAAYERQK